MENKKPPNRRDFIKGSLSLGLLSTVSSYPPFSSSSFSDLDRKGKAISQFVCPPYLQAPTPHSIVIQWINHFPIKSWVAYGEDKSLGMKAYPIQHGQIINSPKIVNIRLEQLKPDTKYYYQAYIQDSNQSNKIRSSAMKEFKTAKRRSKTCTITLLNNIKGEWENLFFNKENTDIVLLNGNILNNASSHQDIIRQFCKPAAEIFANKIPFLTARGKEEIQTCEKNGLLNSYLCNPGNKYYYSYRMGPLFFIVLDNPLIHPGETPSCIMEQYIEKQADWLEKIMQAPDNKKAPFKVVVCPSEGNNMEKLFRPILEKHKIDLFIKGQSEAQHFLDDKLNSRNPFPILTTGIKKHPKVITNLSVTPKQLSLEISNFRGKPLFNYSLPVRPC